MSCDISVMNEIENAVSKTPAKEHFSLDLTDIKMDDLPKDFAAGEVKRRLGFFGNFRTIRGAFGDGMAVAINSTQQKAIELENLIARYYDKLGQAFEPLGYKGAIGRSKLAMGVPTDLNKRLATILEQVDGEGRFRGRAGEFSDKEIEVAKNVRKVYNELFEISGIDPDKYVNGYRPLIRQRPSGFFKEMAKTPEEERFIRNLTPEEIKFYHEYERTGRMQDPDPTLTAGFTEYLHSMVRAKMMKPHLQQVEKEFVNPYFGTRFVNTDKGPVGLTTDPIGYKAWQEYTGHLLGVVTPMDRHVTYNLSKLARLFGKEVDVRSTYKISHIIQSLYYSGAMGSPIGGRPSSIIRQLSQLVPTFADMGAKDTLIGLQRAFDKTQIQRLRDMNILSSPLEAVVEQVDLARSVGRGVSQLTEHGLKLFTATDTWLRATAALAAESKFNDALATNTIKQLGGRKPIMDYIKGLVEKGQIDKARNAYMFENVAQTQYIYGKANRPAAFRGALGNLIGMFMGYPLNTVEMWNSFIKRAATGVHEGNYKEAMPLLKLMGIASGVMMAGAEFLDADLTSAFYRGAMPDALTMPKMAMDSYKVGNTTVEWLLGNLYQVGETDYHKRERMEAYKQIGSDLKPFLPGGVFFFDDLPKTIDEGSLRRMLALTPKADELNQRAQEKARETARSNRPAGIQGLRGLPSIGG